MLEGILSFLYFLLIVSVICLTPCYFLLEARKKIFQYASVWILYRASILFNLAIMVAGFIALDDAVSTLKLAEAGFFRKAMGVISYGYGWELQHIGWQFLIASFVVAVGLQFVLRRMRLKKV